MTEEGIGFLQPVVVAYGAAFVFAVVVILLGLFSRREETRSRHS